MAIPKQKFRELVFQLLYSYDLAGTRDEEMIPLMMKQLEVTKKAVREAQQAMRAILERQSDIDKLIGETSASYSFSRIQLIERNILRLAVYELLFDEQIPPKVAIAEAIRLARKFGTPESANFINAVLDNLYKKKEGHAVDESNIDQTITALTKSEEAAHDAAKACPPKLEFSEE